MRRWATGRVSCCAARRNSDDRAPPSGDLLSSLSAKWGAVVSLPRNDWRKALELMAPLLDETTRHRRTVLVSEQLCVPMWAALAKFRVAEAQFRDLLVDQMQMLSPTQRSYVAYKMHHNPNAVHAHIHEALTSVIQSPDYTDGVQEACDESEVLAAGTLVQIGQLLRRLQRQRGCSVGIALSAASMEHVCRVARAEIRDDRRHTVTQHQNAAADVLRALLFVEGVTLLNPQWVAKSRATAMASDLVAAFGASGRWADALKAVETLTSFKYVHGKHKLRAFVDRLHAWQLCLALLQHDCEHSRAAPAELRRAMASASSWGAAAAVFCAWRDAPVKHRNAVDWIGLTSSIVQRADVPWMTALRLFSWTLSKHVTAGELRVSHALRALNKVPAPVPTSVVERALGYCDVHAFKGTPWVAMHAHDLIATHSNLDENCYQANGVEAEAGPRWDLAMELLCATQQYDIAAPLWIHAKEHRLLIGLTPPPELLAFLEGAGHGLPQQFQALPPGVRDATVLGSLLRCRSVRTARLCGRLAAELSPRTQTLLSSQLNPGNPFSAIFHGCYAYQSKAATHGVLQAATAAQRQAFGASISSSGGRHRWLWEHCGGGRLLDPHKGGSIEVPVAFRNSSDILSLERASRLTHGEARAFLRSVLGESRETAVWHSQCRVNSEDRWDAFLLLVRLGGRERRGRSDSADTDVCLEVAALKYAARLMAAGALLLRPEQVVRGLLRLLLVDDMCQAPTVKLLAESVSLAELRKCPLASATAARGFALCGDWERAMCLLVSVGDVSTCRHATDESLRQWRRSWLDVSLCVPRHLQRSVGRAALSMSQEHSGVRTLRRIMEGLWKRNPAEAVRWLTAGAASPEAASNGVTFRVVLTAALCLLDTRAELFPVAWAVGRPLAFTDVRAPALHRVLRALTWERSISVLQDIQHRCGTVNGSWILDVYERWDLSPAAVERCVDIARRSYSSANFACSIIQADLCLRCGDFSFASRYLRIAQLCFHQAADDACSPRFLQRLLTAGVDVMQRTPSSDEHVADASSQDSARDALALSVSSAVDMCFRTQPLLVRLMRKRLPEMCAEPVSASISKEFVLRRSLLSLAFIFLHVSREKKHIVHPKVVSSVMRLAAQNRSWEASLYFFSALRHPNDEERRVLVESLCDASWRTALHVLIRHERFAAGRPDVSAHALVLLVGALCSPNSTSHNAQNDEAVSYHAHVDACGRCCQVLVQPPQLRKRFAELASAVHTLDATAVESPGPGSSTDGQSSGDVSSAALSPVVSEDAKRMSTLTWSHACRLLASQWRSWSVDDVSCVQPQCLPDPGDVSVVVVRRIRQSNDLTAAKALLSLDEAVLLRSGLHLLSSHDNLSLRLMVTEIDVFAGDVVDS